MVLSMIKDDEQSWGSFVLEMVILLAIVLCVRFYVFQFFRVSGPSMCPTLNQLDGECESGKGEFVFVNEFLYHFIKDPQRGEVVVFRPPTEKTYYIKRVIGVPGDRVKIRNGKIFVNERALHEPYLTSQDNSNMEQVFLLEGQYFVLGDNRRGSNDSRNWGPVPEENVLGKVWIIYWPLSKWGLLG